MFDKVLSITEDEIRSVAEHGKYRTREDVDLVYKLVDIVKDIYCIQDMEMGGGSYEGGEGSYRSYRGSYEGSYRGRGSGAKRYADGRYAPYSRDGSYRSYRGYSRDGEDFVEQLHQLKEAAPDEQTRQSIEKLIQQM